MKPFIYLSILLITAGSAFGLVDYFKEKDKGTFATLYKDEEETPEAPITGKEKIAPLNVSNVTEAVASKTTTESTTVKAVEAKKLKKKAPRKKISLKMFTRGDEVEGFTPPVIIEEPVIEKPAVAEPVAEKPEIKVIQPTTNIAIEKAEKRPSLTKMFSRARPPKRVKNIEVKPVE